MKRLGVALGALAVAPLFVGVAPSAAADIPTPPRASLNVYGLKVTGAWNPARGYCAITATASGYWKQAPPPKGSTNGHYLMVTTEVIAPAGYGGTLIKSLERERFTSKTFLIPNTGLPKRFDWAARYTTRYGTGEYGARITVRVVRAVVGGFDTTAWKLVAKTSFKSVDCQSTTGFAPPPGAASPSAGGGD